MSRSKDTMKSKWISVTERLPKPNTLVRIKAGDVILSQPAEFYPPSNTWFWSNSTGVGGYEITHWEEITEKAY